MGPHACSGARGGPSRRRSQPVRASSSSTLRLHRPSNPAVNPAGSCRADPKGGKGGVGGLPSLFGQFWASFASQRAGPRAQTPPRYADPARCTRSSTSQPLEAAPRVRTHARGVVSCGCIFSHAHMVFFSFWALWALRGALGLARRLPGKQLNTHQQPVCRAARKVSAHAHMRLTRLGLNVGSIGGDVGLQALKNWMCRSWWGLADTKCVPP
jgi:hypothetical protein